MSDAVSPPRARQPIRAVIFDLDGTLLDSAPDITRALNAALDVVCRAPLTQDAVVRLIGGGSRALVARALGGDADTSLIDRTHDEFLAAYSAAPVTASRLYDGAQDVLQTLTECGIALALCTNKPERITFQILNAFGLRAHFSAIVAATPGGPLKPDREAILAALRPLNVPPDLAAMVGDSRADIAAAHAAACRSILLSHGYEIAPLTALGADVIVERLQDVPAAILSLS